MKTGPRNVPNIFQVTGMTSHPHFFGQLSADTAIGEEHVLQQFIRQASPGCVTPGAWEQQRRTTSGLAFSTLVAATTPLPSRFPFSSVAAMTLTARMSNDPAPVSATGDQEDYAIVHDAILVYRGDARVIDIERVGVFCRAEVVRGDKEFVHLHRRSPTTD